MAQLAVADRSPEMDGLIYQKTKVQGTIQRKTVKALRLAGEAKLEESAKVEKELDVLKAQLLDLKERISKCQPVSEPVVPAILRDQKDWSGLVLVPIVELEDIVPQLKERKFKLQQHIHCCKFNEAAKRIDGGSVTTSRDFEAEIKSCQKEIDQMDKVLKFYYWVGK